MTPDREPSLTALATTVARVASHLEGLETAVAGVASRLEGLETAAAALGSASDTEIRIEVLEEQFRGIKEVVDRLTADDASKRERGWVWWKVDPDEAGVAWAALLEWVRWLVANYPPYATSLGNCWHEHPQVVHILAALHDAWLGAYSETSNSPARIDYEIHWLADGMRLIEKITGGGTCDGIHDPGRLKSDDARLSAFIEADLERRRMQSGQQP